MKTVACTQRAVSTPREVEVGATYKHYKKDEAQHQNNEYLYKVICISNCSENVSKLLVTYKALYPTKLTGFFTRSYDMFVEDVEIDGKMIPRFEKVEDGNAAGWKAVYGEPQKLDEK